MKKIDIKKSTIYKFDSKEDLSKSVLLLGEKGYFSDKWNFEHYEMGVLYEVLCGLKEVTYPFTRMTNGSITDNESHTAIHKYFIPEDKVVFENVN